MKGSPCCAGLMRSCLHTYRTNQLDSAHHPTIGGGHQPSMGGPSVKYGGAINQLWGGISQVWGAISQVWGAISQVWGGHQPTMGGHQPSMGGHQSSMGGHQPSMGGSSTNYGGPSAKYGGVINQLWGAISQVWGGGIFPPVCTGSQNPENYFSNTYVLPSVNRTAGPTSSYPGWIKSPHVVTLGILKISDLDSLSIFIGGYSGVNFGHPKSEVLLGGVFRSKLWSSQI